MSGAVAGAASCALLCDVLCGEPPTHLHPTVWMGRWLRVARTKFAGGTCSRTRTRAFAAGLLTVTVGLAVVLLAVFGVTLAVAWLTAALLRDVARGRSAWAAMTESVAQGLLLKPALACRALVSASREVACALEANDLDRARQLLSWHLVSRDTTQLSAEDVAGAALSSLAENFSDSVVAPLLAYRVAGLAGAYGYRFVNTADAMHGYRTPALEWFGKPAARLDDVLNLVPARLSVCALLLGAAVCGGSVIGGVRAVWRDAGRTASPNGGWPMACLAGALNVQLVKRDHYVLHAAGQMPQAADVMRASVMIGVAVAITVLVLELSLVA